jgi:hypothetical protein
MVPIEACQGASSESQVNLDRVLKEDNQCEGGWFVGKLRQRRALEDDGLCRTTSVVRQSPGRAHADIGRPREEGEEEGRGCCTRRASSCLYVLCTLSMLGVVSISPQ